MTRSGRSRASEGEGVLVSLLRRLGILIGICDAPDNILDGFPDALTVLQALDVLPLPCKSAVQVVPICSGAAQLMGSTRLAESGIIASNQLHLLRLFLISESLRCLGSVLHGLIVRFQLGSRDVRHVWTRTVAPGFPDPWQLLLDQLTP